jgi:copper(I)-binding protein
MKFNKVLTAALLLAGSALYAQTVEVSGAWVRATVPGQMGTGAFMSLTAREGARLVGVSSPVAGVAEVHEMKMEGDIMKMRALPALELPAGQAVQLKPGGYHLMLMDLKQPLPKGGTVPLTLRFQDAKGLESKLEIKVPVSAVAPAAMAGKPPAQTDGKAEDHGAHKH